MRTFWTCAPCSVKVRNVVEQESLLSLAKEELIIITTNESLNSFCDTSHQKDISVVLCYTEAPWELKASYAFRIFDYNSDAQICSDDLEELLIAITGDGLTNEEITAVVERVLKEADIDQDGRLSYPEFEHMISRAPDFVNLFRMTV